MMTKGTLEDLGASVGDIVEVHDVHYRITSMACSPAYCSGHPSSHVEGVRVHPRPILDMDKERRCLDTRDGYRGWSFVSAPVPKGADGWW